MKESVKDYVKISRDDDGLLIENTAHPLKSEVAEAPAARRRAHRDLLAFDHERVRMITQTAQHYLTAWQMRKCSQSAWHQVRQTRSHSSSLGCQLSQRRSQERRKLWDNRHRSRRPNQGLFTMN